MLKIYKMHIYINAILKSASIKILIGCQYLENCKEVKHFLFTDEPILNYANCMHLGVTITAILCNIILCINHVY